MKLSHKSYHKIVFVIKVRLDMLLKLQQTQSGMFFFIALTVVQHIFTTHLLTALHLLYISFSLSIHVVHINKLREKWYQGNYDLMLHSCFVSVKCVVTQYSCTNQSKITKG